MEAGFGTDFSGVRIHTDSQAVRSIRNWGAGVYARAGCLFWGGEVSAGDQEGSGCWRMSWCMWGSREIEL
ncbi:MAG: DUF4157 domain-containing protein [Saprospirales bacterium]|nr:DUF4157 domain-containing protein [Saprospirales bacterium]